MNCRLITAGVWFLFLAVCSGLAAPVIDPLPAVTIAAGKSLILPVTATSSSGNALTYTITSSTNAIAVVMHTNNPFWQLTVAQAADPSSPGAYPTPYRGGLVSVTNVGTMTFEMLPEYAPHTVNVFQGLTTSGFYNSNTIFHRTGYSQGVNLIQGGDPQTNGTGGLVFKYNDELNPQAIFSGNGQLALANSGPNTDGSQFFVTVGAERFLDFGYTLFGQLVRGFPVLNNIYNTPTDPNSRPLADEIIQTASYVTNTTDTVVTLCATNVAGIKGTLTVIADDGAGGRATNTFVATTATDTNSNDTPIQIANTVTNLVAPLNTALTNTFVSTELDGVTNYWSILLGSLAQQNDISPGGYYTNTIFRNLTYNVTNLDGSLVLYLTPATNYAGPVRVYFIASSSASWYTYYQYGLTPLPPYNQQIYTFVYGDTPINGKTNTVTALAGVPFDNLVLATFTNGVPASAATNFTALINWGDDSTNTVAATANAAGIKAVLGSHTYPYPGSYPVYVTVQSGIGATATVLSFVNVTNPPVPATNYLTVQVTGQGTVSPAYVNAPLLVGQSYSISASPSPLWLFSGWTDANGYVLGTSTNLTFTVTPGMALTANFLQAVAPTLTITAPANGQVITNLYSALATMTGTISNNATVTNVYYQLNGGGWLSATGTTNWTAAFTPAYGVSNVLQAYAVNNFGYLSTTSKVQVKYLAGDVLSVATNGLGSIAPSLNGDLLPLGSNYVLTATPATGFTFANWSGSLHTNKAALSFTMATNLSLVANFADATAPTLTITTPTGGQQIISNQFNVQGTASDNNWQVASVLYSLNNTGWTNATSGNNWSNWLAAVTLTPGTNTVAAYAVDPNGQPSLTNSVSVQYLVTNQLQIRALGLGTITPNDSNAWLNLGQNYAITATPATGFTVTNWTVSTNWVGGVITNKPAVQFMMASNLTLQVAFAETAKPSLTITWPTAGLHLTNALPTVVGTASDIWGVTGVWYQLNSGPWTNPFTANGWTNWSTTLKMVAGNNTINAYAQNLGGNYSTTNTLSVVSSNTFKLLLSLAGTNGWTTNGYNFSVQVSTNLYGHIQFATNLAATNAWSTLTNFAGSNGVVIIRDSAATNSPQRFYRAVIP